MKKSPDEDEHEQDEFEEFFGRASDHSVEENYREYMKNGKDIEG